MEILLAKFFERIFGENLIVCDGLWVGNDFKFLKISFKVDRHQNYSDLMALDRIGF